MEHFQPTDIYKKYVARKFKKFKNSLKFDILAWLSL